MQVQNEKYGIKNYFSGTIHSAMSDILPSVSIELSMADNNNSMWDKVHPLLILSHTNLARDNITFRDK